VTLRNYARQGFRFLLPLLYGRSRFKLFLKTSVEDVDLRVQRLASLTDLFSEVVRPVRIHPPFGKSMLVLAPHQDDETIGCGGAIALQARSECPVHILLLTDGADGHEDLGMSRRELAELRNEESRRASVLLGVPPPEFLGYPSLVTDAGVISERLAGILRTRKIDVVFTPFLLDAHTDHRRANVILADALRTVSTDVRILGYEVWSFAIPNVVVAIDDVIERKLRALRCFEFANHAVNYTWSTEAINMYRCRVLEAGTSQYAECFFETPREEFIRLVERVQAAETAKPKANPSEVAV